MAFESELDTPLILDCLVEIRDAESYEFTVNSFMPLYTNLKKKAAQMCIFYPRGNYTYSMIELTTMGQWMAMNPEVASFPCIPRLFEGIKDVRLVFSSIIPSMISMIEEWKTYPMLDATYENTKGYITSELIPESSNYFLLVCNLSFLDKTSKAQWSSSFEARVLELDKDERCPVCIMLDVGATTGIAILLDTSEHWLSSGGYIPGIVTSEDDNTTCKLDESVASLTAHHVYCETAHASVLERIHATINGMEGCSFESMKTIGGGFIYNPNA